MQEKIFHLYRGKQAALGYSPPYTVPVPLTSLIGRQREVAAICDLLREAGVRLVTLIGPGGVGKTHLGLQVALDLLDDFADGVCFVPLAPIADPTFVVATISHELGLKEVGDEPLLELLKEYLRPRHLLLMLDNFEQVVAGAPLVADLLASCPKLKVLVTSRAILHIRGERQFQVRPLELPDLERAENGEILAHYPAVALFLQRAREARPGFQLTDATVQTIARICVQLDGLPLAIELAAARLKLLTPQLLLERLAHPLALLTSGAQDAPERQQTLRATLEWSYRLLHAREQRLLRRLAVFGGGATLEAIEAMGNAFDDRQGAEQVLDDAASLIDKSLLQRIDSEGGEPRITMLETIREYALERLVAEGEAESAYQGHALYYLRLSQEAAQHVRGPQQVQWLQRLEGEHDNLRAAFRWLLEDRQGARETRQHHIETALRLCQALIGFWQIHGHYSEGRRILEQVLSVSEGLKTPERAQALNDAAMLVNLQGDTARAAELSEKSLALYRELGDQEGIALAVYQLGHIAWLEGDFDRAVSLLQETLGISKALGDTSSVAYAYYSLGGLANIRGQYSRGVALYEEALALFRQEGNKRGIAHSLLQIADTLFISQGDATRIHPLLEGGLALCQEIGDRDGVAHYDYYSARVALDQGDVATARALLEESLALYRDMGDRQRIARSLLVLGRLEARQGNYAVAQSLYEESLNLSRVGHMLNMISSLEGLALTVAVQGIAGDLRAHILWAARLWGTAESLRAKLDVPLPPFERAEYERSTGAARSYLGPEAFSAAWAEGKKLSPEQALSHSDSPAISRKAAGGRVSVHPVSPGGLTPREVEVLRLLAQGLTDAQIAEKLVITRRTVNWYLTSIYSKIHVSSRAAATRYALEHHLA